MKDKCFYNSWTYQCNNEFRDLFEPCHTKKGTLCPEGWVLRNGSCTREITYPDLVWKCGDSLISKTEVCHHQGKLTCPEDHCYNVETRGCTRTEIYPGLMVEGRL